MLTMVKALLLAFGFVGVAAKAGKLTDANFASIALSEDYNTIVMFFAPWCGHCKDLKPNFLELAKDYMGHEKAFIGTVDCTDSRPTCAEQGIDGYPTVKYYIGGKADHAERYMQHAGAAKGVYTDWHGAGTTAPGYAKLKAFVLQILAEGVEPPPREPDPPPTPPEKKPEQEKRPKGWWKNPEKWAKPKPEGSSSEMPGRKIGQIKNTVNFGDEEAVKATHNKAQQDTGYGDAGDDDEQDTTAPPAPPKGPNVVLTWDADKVSDWLTKEMKLGNDIVKAAKEEGVDGPMLAVMDKSDWKELGVKGLKGAKIVGAVKKLEEAS